MKSEKQKIKKVYMLYHRNEKDDDKLIGFFQQRKRHWKLLINGKK